MYTLVCLYWIAINDKTNKIWWSPFNEGVVMWKREKELLADIARFYHDERKRKTVSHPESGIFRYVANNESKDSYTLIRIEEENKQEYIDLLNSQVEIKEPGSRYHY